VSGPENERRDHLGPFPSGKSVMDLAAKTLRQNNTKLGILSLISVLLVSSFALAQGEREFKDKANGFRITLTGKWIAVPYTDAVGRQKTDFVYENRDLGVLRVTRENLTGNSLKDMVRRQIDDFTLCYSCVSTSQEEFAGASLTGFRVAVYYVEGDRRIAGTFYFLQDKQAVWILRFNGRAGSPGMERGFTDVIARSFCVFA